MEELIKRLERVIATGASDKDGMHPISAEAVLEVVKELSELSTNLAEVGTDCISRQQAIDIAQKLTITLDGYEMNNQAVANYCVEIMQLPPIQSEIIRCKDCKHWKDSDGVFRRGIGVESKCPLNLHQVYEGTFYCGLGERKEVAP